MQLNKIYILKRNSEFTINSTIYNENDHNSPYFVSTNKSFIMWAKFIFISSLITTIQFIGAFATIIIFSSYSVELITSAVFLWAGSTTLLYLIPLKKYFLIQIECKNHLKTGAIKINSLLTQKGWTLHYFDKKKKPILISAKTEYIISIDGIEYFLIINKESTIRIQIKDTENKVILQLVSELSLESGEKDLFPKYLEIECTDEFDALKVVFISIFLVNKYFTKEKPFVSTG